MCGTCKYCLAFFQAAGAFAAAVLGAACSLHFVFGGTPPVYTMTFGFWILYLNSFTAIYISLFLVRVVGEGLYTTWTSKYVLAFMVFLVVIYFASAVLFFIPITEARMMLFSRHHIHQYDHIPPFLDTIQQKYDCCGIYDYLDYNDTNKLGRGRKPKIVEAMILPTDPKWYLVEHISSVDNAPPEGHTSRDHKIPHKELRKKIKTIVFNITRSCCPYNKRVADEYCFVDVEYGNNAERNNISAREKVNNPGLGCFDKYESILSLSGKTYQLPWLIKILQWGSLLQSLEWFLLIWVFRLTIRALIQHGVTDPFEEPEEVKEEEDEYELMMDNQLREGDIPVGPSVLSMETERSGRSEPLAATSKVGNEAERKKDMEQGAKS